MIKIARNFVISHVRSIAWKYEQINIFDLLEPIFFDPFDRIDFSRIDFRLIESIPFSQIDFESIFLDSIDRIIFPLFDSSIESIFCPSSSYYWYPLSIQSIFSRRMSHYCYPLSIKDSSTIRRIGYLIAGICWILWWASTWLTRLEWPTMSICYLKVKYDN